MVLRLVLVPVRSLALEGEEDTVMVVVAAVKDEDVDRLVEAPELDATTEEKEV